MAKKTKDCDCLKKMAKLLVKKIEAEGKAKFPDAAFTTLESGFDNLTIYPNVRIYTTFTLKYTHKKSDGTESKPKNIIKNVMFTHCPFCGQKYND